MFWGLILKSNKKYTQTLEKSFHLSQATLDHSSSDNEPVQVMYTQDENSYLLCTLQKGKIYQAPLDLNFQEGDKLCFSTKGNGIVHLTGFLIEDDFDDMNMDLDDEDEEESETEIEDLRNKLSGAGKKKQPKEEAASKKKAKQADSDEEEESDDEDFNETAEAVEEDSDDDDEDGEEADSDEEEDDDSDDDEVPAPPAKQQKLDPKAQQNGKKQKQKNGLENGEKKKEQKEPQQQQKQEKGGDGKVQKLQGGLMVQDLKVGSGAEAKPGKKIQVYYEGRLKTNNKVFDSTKSGAGFKMTVGRGEVIKAWDIGVNGMKVGGKRRLVCPPQLAYGAKGSPPVIPPNATLVFDVELKNVL